MLFEILSELIKINDLIFIIKNSSVTSEIKSDFLTIKQNEKWITLGNNEDPGHMHINSETIKSIKFVQEQKPERTSFSIRFFDKNEKQVLAVYFTKMYDFDKNLDHSRKKIYDVLFKKYGPLIQI